MSLGLGSNPARRGGKHYKNETNTRSESITGRLWRKSTKLSAPRTPKSKPIAEKGTTQHKRAWGSTVQDDWLVDRFGWVRLFTSLSHSRHCCLLAVECFFFPIYFSIFSDRSRHQFWILPVHCSHGAFVVVEAWLKKPADDLHWLTPNNWPHF